MCVCVYVRERERIVCPYGLSLASKPVFPSLPCTSSVPCLSHHHQRPQASLSRPLSLLILPHLSTLLPLLHIRTGWNVLTVKERSSLEDCLAGHSTIPLLYGGGLWGYTEMHARTHTRSLSSHGTLLHLALFFCVCAQPPKRPTLQHSRLRLLPAPVLLSSVNGNKERKRKKRISAWHF